MKMTGADLIIRLLERQGIRLIAGIPGGANLPLYDALARRPVIHHILARHEQGAGFIAQGLARVTGQPAVCFATSGPGATNILTAIADARMDSIPLVCISGQVPQALMGTDAFQEVDVIGMSKPVTKYNHLVRSAEELLQVIPEAFRIASSGRPGPVWIDIPKDIQNSTVEFDEWPNIGIPAPRIAADDNLLQMAASMIEESERPILYLGGGVIHSDAAEEARTLMEKSQLPTVSTLMALGAIPSDHPLSLGMLGMHAAAYTNMALEECDLLIAIGARFDDRATGKVSEFCPNAKVIHIDIDARELGKIRKPTLGIRADIQCALQSLLPRLQQRRRTQWNQCIQTLRREHPLHTPGAEDPSTPYGLIQAIARHAGRDAIISTDVGQHQMWTAQAFPFIRPRQWLTSGGAGTMGFGVPAALGAALSHPEQAVVCITGDGSFLMNNQEIITAVEEGADLKIVLFNNQSLGLVHQQQSLFYGKRYMASRFQHNPDYVMMAESMGMRAIDLKDAADPDALLAEAFSTPGPVLIHAPIATDEKVFPMVPPGGANREMVFHPAGATVTAARAAG